METFLSEAEDHTRVWEQTLLDLEKGPEDTELMGRLFRSIHTLKGCAGFVGCEQLQELTHELESALQAVREGQARLEGQLIDALFDGLDLTKRLIASLVEGTDFDGDIEGLVARVRSLKPEAGPGVEEMAGTGQEAGEQRRRPQGRTVALEVEILADKREAYLRAMLIRNKLEENGRIVEISPALEDLRLGEVEFRFQIFMQTDRPVEMLRRDIDIDQVNILSCRELDRQEEHPGREAQQGEERESAVTAEEEKGSAQGPHPVKIEEIVRVPVDKLDTMMNLVGELVVQNSGVISTVKAAKAADEGSPRLLELEQKTESLARIARSLQDAVMKVRMLPVATIFSRFNRVIRDLAKHRGKEVELEILGEETEIDKKVIDRIGQPLIHLLRNAVDHGIEPQADRLAYGKDAKGHIQVGAYQEGDHICVEVKDDGQGLCREAIAAKAVEKGLVSAAEVEKMTDEEVFEYIFRTGFSTAKELTDVSGRGVGMDIVKRAVEEMGGSVRLQSTLGLGTSTTITLPLTMAIINALLIEDGGFTLAIPLSSVREVIQPRPNELQRFDRNRVFRLRDEVIAVLELGRVLSLRSAPKQSSVWEQRELSIVVVEYGNTKVGLVVDALKGREEIVIKSLARNFEEIEGLVGASILGTGKIALILDVRSLLDSYYRENEAEGALVRRLAAETGEKEARKAGEKTAVGAPPEAEAAAAGRLSQTQDPEQEQEPEQGNEERAELREQQPSGAHEIPWGRAELARFEEILIGGAVQASRALSELLSRDIRVSFPEFKIMPIGEVAAALGGEEIPAGGIFVEIEGDIAGGTLLVLPDSYLKQLSDLLLARETGTTKEVGEEEASALKETGNILSASFIGAISDATGLDVRLRVPDIGMDMCQAVIDSVLARFNQPGRHTLLIEADLYYTAADQVVCHLLILLERESLELLMERVSGGAG
jgi:two-component system chemotaxis sensor kinase CheA